MRDSRAQICDDLLVLRCQQGDRKAFDELVQRWQERFWRHAYHTTGCESAAWDIVQDTWVAIINGLRKLNDVAAFPQWAFRILHNKCVDWLRQQMKGRLENQVHNQAEESWETHHGSDEDTERLRAAMAKLSPEQRALVSLRYQQDFEINEVAEILGVPEGTVKSRLHRTLGELREVMGTEHNG